MQHRLFYVLGLFMVTIFTMTCSDDDLSTNEDCSDLNADEFLTYDYNNFSGPSVSSTPIDASKNVTSGPASVRQSGNDVIISIPGIRVRTDDHNYRVTDFAVDENKGTCFQTQSEFGSATTSVKTDILSVLVLDMSTSLESIIDDLKRYAKEYASTIVSSSDNSQVAVVFFSSRSAIEVTPFYGASDIASLHGEIDAFQDYQKRTALFQATQRAIELVENTQFNGEKSLVVFTDGGDNDSNNPTALKSLIESSSVNRFAIGLRGDDFRESDLNAIPTTLTNRVIANDASSLEQIFKTVTRGVISVYQIEYARSDQELGSNETIEVRFKMKTEKIE
ncbi:MAG: vWA domain-containing protein [Bacteroidota bacterium]